MLIHELTNDQCLEVISRNSLGRLGCCRADQAYIVPVQFSFDAGRQCLYCFSSFGQKVLWMRENPKVCVEIEEIESKDQWTTVLVFGRYQEIGDTPDEAETRQRVWELFQHRTEWWLPAAAKVGSRERHATIVCQIHIDRTSGRRSQRQRV